MDSIIHTLHNYTSQTSVTHKLVSTVTLLLTVEMVLPASIRNSSCCHPITRDFLPVEVEVTLQLTVKSVCQGIEPTLRLVTRHYFLSKGCFLKVAVLSLWGALSGERSGLSFVFLSLVIYQYLHQAFTLHAFYSFTASISPVWVQQIMLY
jgi:hypothetical protein